MSPQGRGSRSAIVAIGVAFAILVVGAFASGLIPGVPALLRPFSIGAFDVSGTSLNQLPGPGGLTVTSVDCNIPIISNAPQLAGSKCLVEAVATGGPDIVTGGFGDARQIGGKYQTGPLNIRVTNVEQTARYTIINLGQPIYAYEVVPWSYRSYLAGLLGGTAAKGLSIGDFAQCPTDRAWDYQILLDKDTNIFGQVENYEWVCARRDPFGGIGSVNFAGSTSKIKFEVAGKGGVREATIDTQTERTVSLGDAGTATWTGDFDIGQSPPTSVNTLGVYDQFAGAWVLNSLSAGEAWKTERTKFESILSTHVSDCNKRGFGFGSTSCFDEGLRASVVRDRQEPLWNSLSSLLYNTQNSIQDPTGAVLGVLQDPSGTVDFADLRVKLNRRLGNPNIRLLLNAEWIGVIVPAGQPEFVGATCTPFPVGQRSTVQVQVKNLAPVPAEFTVGLTSCPLPISTFESVPIGANAQVTAVVPVTYNVAGSVSCGVRITDSATGTRVERANAVSCEVRPEAPTCIEGQSSLATNTYSICRNGKFEVVAQCSGTQSLVIRDGNPACVDRNIQGATGGVVVQGEPLPPPEPLPAPRPRVCDVFGLVLPAQLCRIPPIAYVVLLIVVGVIGFAVYQRRRGL